jgi:regulator of cell morphogenesis and NO signaling
MENIATKTIREIAVEAPATTRVFEEYKIDYCCHGNTPLGEACRKAGVSPDVINQKINDLLWIEEGGELSPGELNLTELADHILERHHVYTKQEMTQLTPLMEKVARKHGEHHPCLAELKKAFQAVCDDLGPHMIKEETVLFPYIKRLEENFSNSTHRSPPPFGTVLNPVRVMRMEHDEVGALLANMRSLTNDYELPNGACPSFAALYHRLEALEHDLHQHIHLENNVLFPRAINLEQQTFLTAVR